MSTDDVAAAMNARVDRSTPSASPVLMRKGVVTVISTGPFSYKVTMNGAEVVDPPRSTSYAPRTGDTVVVLLDGAAPYVLMATNQSKPVGARIRRSVDQGIVTATQSTIVFNTQLEDEFGFYNGGTGGLSVPVGFGGKYLLSAHCRWEGTTVAGPILVILVNGVPVIRHQPSSGFTGSFVEQACSTPWTCADSDSIIAQVFHSSGTTKNVSTVAASGTDPAGPILEMWKMN